MPFYKQINWNFPNFLLHSSRIPHEITRNLLSNFFTTFSNFSQFPSNFPHFSSKFLPNITQIHVPPRKSLNQPQITSFIQFSNSWIAYDKHPSSSYPRRSSILHAPWGVTFKFYARVTCKFSNFTHTSGPPTIELPPLRRIYVKFQTIRVKFQTKVKIVGVRTLLSNEEKFRMKFRMFSQVVRIVTSFFFKIWQVIPSCRAIKNVNREIFLQISSINFRKNKCIIKD